MDGTPFGRYRLVALLGRGGMGEVWRAFDTETSRVVAVKVLPAGLREDEVFKERFRREANAAAALTEPHVVPIHHFGEIDGRLYVDMRLIEGRDLQSMLAEGPLAPSRAVMIVEQVAAALNAAHRVGLVHRDVKPSNVLVAEFDFAYLIDFGISQATGAKRLTDAGSMVGTWAYMAPERLRASGGVQPPSDVYALACVLHECVTGRQPFPGESMESQITAHLVDPPPRPSVARPGVPSGFDAVIARGMAKDPGRRFRSTLDLARAARAALSSPVVMPDSRTIPVSLDQPTARVVTRRPTVGRGPATPPPTPPPSPPPSPPRALVTPPPVTPPPVSAPGDSGRRRIWMIAGGIAVIALVTAAIFGANQLTDKPTNPNDDKPIADTSTTEAPPEGPPVMTAAMLDGLLLSVDELNRIVGSNRMTMTYDASELSDNSGMVDNLDCLGAKYSAQQRVYNNAGWKAVRDQIIQEPADNMSHYVSQTVVLFPTALRAQEFVRFSKLQWDRCVGKTITTKEQDVQGVWRVEGVQDVRAQENLITQRMVQNDTNDWGCEHALASVRNLVVETIACRYGDNNDAVTIANRIAANAKAK